VGALVIQGYEAFAGDPARCLEDNIVAFEAQALDLRPHTVAGTPVVGKSQPERASAVFEFVGSAGGALNDYVVSLECRALVPGRAVLYGQWIGEGEEIYAEQ
jgi:hypothetical protein